MTGRIPLLGLAAAILAAAGLLAGSAWLGRRAAREARLETIRVEAREAAGETTRRFAARIAALAERESRRPFYLYQHFYSPPDALAAQFVLQTSPLAVSSEPLVSTYFEVLPDGRLSLPQEEPGGAPDEAARRLVGREALPELLARVRRAERPAEPAAVAAAGGAPGAAIEHGPDRAPSDARRAQGRGQAKEPSGFAARFRGGPGGGEAPCAEQPPGAGERRPPREPPAQRPGAAAPPPDGPPDADQAGRPDDAPPQADPRPPQQQQHVQGQRVGPLPRWAVETNVRAEDIARQIELANEGDLATQQQLQADYNILRGMPGQATQQQAAPPPAQSVLPSRQEPDAGGDDARQDVAAPAGVEPAEPPERPVRPGIARRAQPPGRSPDRRRPATPAPTAAAADAGAASAGGTRPPDPAPGAGDDVPVVYGEFEPLGTTEGVTYFARTVEIEGDVRVQGFRLDPAGLRAALDDVLGEVQRGRDAFRLAAEGADARAGGVAVRLASVPLDGAPRNLAALPRGSAGVRGAVRRPAPNSPPVQGIAAVSAFLRPDSPALRAEADEDRRVRRLLGGLSAVIAVAVLLAFLVLRREVDLARRKSEFLSAVSHELRAPVTTIRMYAEMLRDGWVGDPGRRAEYESAIVGEGERLSRLVDNVLAYARRERGKPLAFREADLAEHAREAAALQRPVFEREGLALEVEAPATLPWTFDADAVTQILVNLLDNALKHSRDAADRRVTVRVAASPEAATIAVEDRGAGIAPAEQRRIFEPFYRVGPELTRVARGAGLGLALVRRLARAHRGAVSVSSEPGRGATFTVRLGRPGRGGPRGFRPTA